jgi:hypothetical protein
MAVKNTPKLLETRFIFLNRVSLKKVAIVIN